MSSFNLSDGRAQLRTLLATGDVRAGLAYLNSLTPHRFTGLYRFDDPTLTNLYIYDAEHPDRTSLPDVPVTATYCAFTRTRGSLLRIDDSYDHPVSDGHPARDEVRSYCGVPLLDGHGQMFGTICHFDYRIVDIPDEAVAMLEEIAPLLPAGRPVV